MSSNPLGPGTRNLTANVSAETYVAIERLARVSGCKVGEYLRALVEDAAAHGILVRDHPGDVAAREKALREHVRPVPKVRKEVAREGERVFALPAAEAASTPTKAGRKG
jgi:hypothetical protein